MDMTCLSAPLHRHDIAKCGSKVLAVFDLYHAVFELRDLGAIDRYVADVYVSHTSTAERSRDGLREHFGQMLDFAFDIRIETHFAVEQDDYAMVLHTFKCTLANGSDLVLRTADCFRFHDTRIAEHWDAVMVAD